LCFEAHGQEFWHGSLRPGDPSANTGVIGFLERCAAKLPGRWRARGCGCGPTPDFSAANCWVFSKPIAGVA
jgi:hypothetical protein